jgi:bla regulator protein blaR1
MYEYEAATIKPSKGPDPGGRIGMWAAPDGFSAWFITLQQIISVAYGVERFQISGGPNWLPSERFDIEAKMDAATADALEKLSQDQRVLAQQQMLQALLANRFQLTVHRETNELTIYKLVIAKGGPKLREAKPDGTHPGAGSMQGSVLGGEVIAQAVPVPRLAHELTLMLGHPVSDKTELKGVYDFKLQFTPDNRLQPPNGLAPNERLPVRPADSNVPSLFDALQEQLGLKLESGKGPVEVIVIDHVERPSPN